MTEHRIGTQEEWQAERDELLKEEKELTRRGDELARKRRELPWVPVEKDYRFETEEGTKALAELFASRAPLEKLLAYRERMGWGIDWVSSGGSDFNRDLGFLHTEEELRPFLEGEIPPVVEQMAEASGTDVAGYVTEGPGLSAYALSDGTVYRTYVTTARGLEPAMAYYGLLDRSPMGRDEGGDRPFWLRRHDEY